MIFLIFTEECLLEAAEEIEQHQASVWINPTLKNNSTTEALSKKGCAISILLDEIDANNEKAVMQALTHVESQTTDTEIYVELS